MAMEASAQRRGDGPSSSGGLPARRERERLRFLSEYQKFLIRKYVLGPVHGAASIIAFVLEPLVPGRFLRLDRPIFIVGCSRSGTTLLLDMLGEHDDIATWSEAAQVFEPRYFNPEIDHLKEARDVGPFDRRRLRFLFGIFQRLRGRTRFLNKHPQNSLRIGFIKEIFPGAKFVHLIRDGRAVIRSNWRQTRSERHRRANPFGYFPRPPRWREYGDLPLARQFAHQWVDILGYVRACAAALPSPDDYIEVRYEDFCRQPYDVLARLDRFLGLHPGRRRHDRIPQKLDFDNGQWGPAFDEDDKHAVMTIAGELLAQLGYGHSDEDSAPEQRRNMT